MPVKEACNRLEKGLCATLTTLFLFFQAFCSYQIEWHGMQLPFTPSCRLNYNYENSIVLGVFEALLLVSGIIYFGMWSVRLYKSRQNDHEHNPSSEGEVTSNLAVSNDPTKEFSEESEAPKIEAKLWKLDELKNVCEEQRLKCSLCHR